MRYPSEDGYQGDVGEAVDGLRLHLGTARGVVYTREADGPETQLARWDVAGVHMGPGPHPDVDAASAAEPMTIEGAVGHTRLRIQTEPLLPTSAVDSIVTRALVSGLAAVADRHALRGHLRHLDGRWREILAHVLVIDRARKILAVNHVAPGYSERQLVGSFVDAFVLPEDMARVIAVVERVFTTGENGSYDTRTPDDSGQIRTYRSHVGAIVEDGKIERAVFVITDISEEVRGMEARAEFERQLQRQQRLEAIGTLAAGVAHQINDPLQAIAGFSELLVGPMRDPLVQRYAAEISREAKRVALIIRGLTMFAEQDGSDAAYAEISKVVAHTLKLIGSLFKSDEITVDVVVPVELPAVGCSPRSLQHVLMNLLTNARDALKSVEGPRRITITAARGVPLSPDSAPRVRLSVTDTGPGIPEALRERIFDPFFSTRGPHRAGLGLPISHRIARSYEGHLSCEESGGGARFHVDLPVATSSPVV